MNSLEVRQKFFDFFKNNGHIIVPSSSLIPAQDPTILFANAGMNQFKDLFLGKEKRSYSKAVSIQKCIRAGGKHNDLENVGFTSRHLTFFEMMGNFSFGDYFKKDAIRFAWDFLTKVIGLDKNKLYASVYYKDDEAYALWSNEIGLPESRIVKLGEKDNFWQMGDTGPCGPCSEIYIDRGASFGCDDGICAPGCHCDRFLEIWNLVFMQFDKQPDGTNKPLKQTGVDTGMGLERLCAVIQNKESVFEIDLFKPLIDGIEKLTDVKYVSTSKINQGAFRVLVDHIRSTSFAIADGCVPSNEGRGYVLRKIIRRAALFSQKLSEKNIFSQLVPYLVESMGTIYPELFVQQVHIVNVLNSEIEKFSNNLIIGQTILSQYFRENQKTKVISGEQAFKLYDTYGFPLELTKVIAHEMGFVVDIDGFDIAMDIQKKQSGKKVIDASCVFDESLVTHFTGYEEHITNAKVIGIYVDNKLVNSVASGTNCIVITDKSPFYVECGGQVSDEGFIEIQGIDAKIETLKKSNKGIGALIVTPVDISVGDKVVLKIASPGRIATMKNHTATHLLQAALVAIFGNQVKQSGSVVMPEYLRFDFTYSGAINNADIIAVEDLVNKKIMENIPLVISQTTLQEALNRGVTAFFGEKYNPENVRVVEIPGFSAELCGGTHVVATGDIGCFKITEISSLSAGNKRIVAVTGQGAVTLFQEVFATIKTLGTDYKVPIDKVLESVKKEKEQLKSYMVANKELEKQMYRNNIPQWLSKIEHFKSVPFLYLSLTDTAKISIPLKDIVTDLMKVQPGLYFIVSQGQEKAQFIAAVSQEYSNLIDLKEFSAWLKKYNITGGGSDNIIQGGAAKIDLDLEYNIKKWLHDHIK